MPRKCIRFCYIITNKKCIKEMLKELNSAVQLNIFKYLNGNEEKTRFLDDAREALSWIGRFTYKGKDGFKKLTEQEYRNNVFEPINPQIMEFISNQQKITLEKYHRLVDFLSHMLAVENELYLPIEFEYVIRYVHSHKNIVDKPIYEDRDSLFPNNLKDFNLKYEYTN